MQGSPVNALEFIQGQNYIEIPYYQRNYDWKRSNCERLITDLLNLHEKDISTHFFGSIVVKPGDLSNQTIVIDGQQRITTVSLLMLAIYNYIMANNLDTEYDPNILYSNYLVNKKKKSQENIKLHSNPRDYEAYNSLFSNSKFFKQASNVTKNYIYFYEVIESKRIGIDDLIESIEKLQFIEINLNLPEDDAQLIFESLNSTGLDLKESDKIRNFLLMNENIGEQNYLYNTYWQTIEELTLFSLEDFFRDYLTVKNSAYPNKNQVYEEFKKFYNSNYINKKRDFFDDLMDYAKTYEQISLMNTDSSEINYQLKRFVKLDVNVLKPFIMSILHDYNNNNLTENDVIEILQVIENYIARRMITQQSSNALNKVFAVLFRDMIKIQQNNNHSSSPSNIISYLLLNKKGTAIFPDDEMVVQSFKQRNFYNINRFFRNFLFERLENKDSNEVIDIYGGLESGTFSIEHIMPQKLSSTWKEQIGGHHQQIHEQFLNSIGNLTLTGYNSSYSNRSFEEKKNIEKGFKDSNFKFLNSIPSKVDVWGEEEIVSRRDSIIERALTIWKMPVSDYKPIIEVDELVPFDGDPSQFTNYSIKGFAFINDEYREANTWVDMYEEVIKELYNIDPTPIIEAVEMNIKDGAVAYTFRKTIGDDNASKYRKIDDGVYVITSSSNWDKFNILRHLLPKYELEYDVLMLDANFYSGLDK
ncbi:MAG: DUF262 domain-containing protein [Neofamilia sp.]